jgi:hypothetical protein
VQMKKVILFIADSALAMFMPIFICCFSAHVCSSLCPPCLA